MLSIVIATGSMRASMPSTLKSISIHNQVIKYLFVSIIAAVADLGTVFGLLSVTSWHYVFIVVIAFTLGTLTNFLASAAFVFRRSGSLFSVGIKHYLSSILGLVTNLAVVIACVEMVGMDVVPAKVIAMAIGFFVNFFAIKFFAFRDYSI